MAVLIWVLFSLLGAVVFCRVEATFVGPRSVANIFPYSNGKIRLNRTALEEILLQPELENKRLIIVSIVGETRGGKSYFMNYLMRYLSSRGWENRTWMGGPQTKANNGFAWTRGIAPNTTGIDIWSHVFTVQDAYGEEVAVLLMDTQGLFDSETTSENNMRLFAYSSLASSLQILNFKERIKEPELQNLQFNAEFAGLVANVDKSVFKLPELMFLVQNWINEDEHKFGTEGGKEYKESLLSPRQGRSELNAVRQNLLSSFDSIRFYLMPHPGSNITDKSFTGTNEEVDKHYLQHVKSFVELIFDKGNLPIKMWQGEPMTAKTLYNFLTSCDDALQSDGMPKVESLGEAVARTHYSNQHDKCLKDYEDEIKAKVEGSDVIGDAHLQEIYDNARLNAMSSFDWVKKMGSDDLRYTYTTRLNDDIGQQFQKTKEKMELKKKEFLRDLEEKCFNDYSSEMNEVTGGSIVDLSTYDSWHENAKKNAERSFEEMASVCEPFTSDGKRRLEGRIGEHFIKQRDLIMEKLNTMEAEKREEQERVRRLEEEKKRKEEERKKEEALQRSKEEAKKRIEAERLREREEQMRRNEEERRKKAEL